jgi:gliding motility-associated-like protein
VIDKAVVISGRYDQGTDIGNFVSEIFSPGASGWIAALSAPGMNGDVVISNPGADTTIVSLYRISALNNCSKAVTPSSPLRNIVLVSVLSGTSIDLKWNNPYPSATALFSVWRDIGSGWEEIAGLLSDTLWSDDYEEFAARVSSETVAYHITASESEASGGTPVSISSVTLVPAVENIFVANAFTPDDNGTNDIFTPVLTFIPSEYEFRIYSRTGVILFHTTKPDTGWDGRHNDKPMPSGVYLWSLRLITPSGRSETRTGTVTILP